MNSQRDQKSAPLASLASEAGEDVTGLVAAAFNVARSAQSNWARTPLVVRLKHIRALRALIADHALELAESSASARNRPVLEALTAEVLPLAEACRFLEKQAPKILAAQRFGGRGRPLWLAGVRSEIHREPWGTVLIIGPGNYPLLLPGVQLIQALVAGNAVVLKPGVGGSRAAHQLRRLIEMAGLDPRLVNLLPEFEEAARVAIAARPNKVLFTGSAAVGEKILAQLAPQLTPATMELSGCDAVIVRADADLNLVVKALKFGLMLNEGATCMAPKRVFLAASCATELEGRLAEALRELTVRPAAASSRLAPLLDEALARGAHFIAGGFSAQKNIRLPVVMGGVAPTCALLREDVFAPVLALVTVADDHEAILRANDCPYALTLSIFSHDEAAARLMAERVNVGVVTINDLIVPTADARLPFGGRNRSGFGSTRGAEGLLELTTAKCITATRGRFRPAFDAPQSGDASLFQSYLAFAHRRGWGARAAALINLLRNLFNRKNSNSER